MAGPDIPAPPEPLALVTREGNALRLSAVDAGARALGLSPGMTLADARAQQPSLMTLPADPAADARELDRLVAMMEHFTPMAAADPPDGIILDISGCAHLFGGEEELAEKAAAATGYTVRHALGPNAAAARALARHASGHADVLALPVAALELPEEMLAALHRAGLRMIGDLARRPMPALAARFGGEAVTRLRQILGEAPSPIAPRRAEPPIQLETRFADPLIRTDDAMEAIEQLLSRAAHELEMRELGARRFDVVLCRSDNARRRLGVETGRPVRDPAIVLRLLRERIDSLADPLDPGFGFDSIRLRLSRTEPLPPRQAELGRAVEDQADGLPSLIDRLSVRLGPGHVLRLTPGDRHLPEVAQVLEPAISTRPTPWPSPGDRPPRPLMMFDPPQPIHVIAGVPDGPPQRFRWQGELHEVRLAEGPERIGSEWWRKRTGHLPGGAKNTRDYYRVEDGQGRRYWIFRHGLFEERPDPGWYLHGLFP